MSIRIRFTYFIDIRGWKNAHTSFKAKNLRKEFERVCVRVCVCVWVGGWVGVCVWKAILCGPCV